MSLRFAILLALIVGAGLLQRVLVRGASSPAAEISLEHLRGQGAEPLAISALVVDPPGPERFSYAYSGGTWRCVSAHDAPVHMGEMGELVLGLAEAVGMPRRLRGRELERAGLDREHAVRVSMRSADGTEVLAVDLGRTLPGPGGGRSFVRRAGEEQLLEIDASLRTLVERPAGSSLPPLLDQRVLAGTHLDPRLGVRRMFIDRPGQSSLELIPHPDAPPEDFAWILLVDGEEQDSQAIPYRVAAWLAFLVRVPYAGFTAAASAPSLGLDEPSAVVTLVPVGGEPIVLEIGRATEETLAPVLNRGSDLVLLVEPEQIELFAPTRDDLLDTERGNPWEIWLRP